MKDNNTPGAPPPNEEIKPKSPTVYKLVFAFKDLHFDDAFSTENGQYLRYFVNNTIDHPYFIDVLKEDYLDYFIIYTDLFEEALENDECSCDTTEITKFEEVDEVHIIAEGEIPETGEKISIDEKYKIYLVKELVENLKMSIHPSHNLNTENND